MTKRNALRMIAIARAAGARVVVGGPDPPHHAERVPRRRRRRRRHRRRRADARRAAAGRCSTAGWRPIWRAIHGIVFKAADGSRRADAAARRCCPISTRQPYPDRAAIDLPAYLGAWRERHGFGTGVADHRARLSVHLHVVQPLGVRRDASPPLGRRTSPTKSRRSSSAIARSGSGTRTTCSRFIATWTLDYARELERRRSAPAVRVHLARRAHRRRRGASARELGCWRVWIGSESGSQRILDAMKRRVDRSTACATPRRGCAGAASGRHVHHARLRRRAG